MKFDSKYDLEKLRKFRKLTKDINGDVLVSNNPDYKP